MWTDGIDYGVGPAGPWPPSPMQFDAQQQIESLLEQYERVDAWLALDEQVAARMAPERSGWSVEQHLAHLALANELAFRNVQSLLQRKGRLIVDAGETGEVAEQILAEGAIPRGASDSPRMVRPPATVQRELLLGWIVDNRSDLQRLSERADEIAAAPGWIPHPLIGTLSAIEWLRFAEVHTRHHTAIAAELVELPA